MLISSKEHDPSFLVVLNFPETQEFRTDHSQNAAFPKGTQPLQATPCLGAKEEQPFPTSSILSFCFGFRVQLPRV